MNLVYIVNARIPTEKAHGIQIFKTCEQLAKLSHLELWIPKRKNFIKEDPFIFYDVERNFLIKRFWCFNFIFLAKRFDRLAFYLQSLSFLLVLLFKKLSKKTIIYTRSPEIAFIFSLKGYQVYFEAHEWSGRSRLFKFFLRRSKGIVCNSEGTKKSFLENNFKKILVAPNGVDLDIFNLEIDKKEARKKLNLAVDKNLLVYTGRFMTDGMEKGIELVLESLKFTDEKTLFLAVGGSNEDLEYYKKIAKQFNVENKVIFLGYVSQRLLAVYQKAADCLLMPFPFNKHYANYMSPIKMFEYMASKRPIVASDLPSVSSILNESNCILVKPDSVLDLVTGIKKALQEPGLADKLSIKAFQDVLNYTWEKRAQNIINFIK